MEVSLSSMSHGALASGYRKENADEDFLYFMVIDAINKAKQGGKDKIHIRIPRNKLIGIKDALLKDGFDVVASID